jgi:hypothetical protein
MSTTVATKRLGKELKDQKGPDGQPAKIICSKVVTGFPADHSSLQVTFDFFLNEDGRLSVHVSRKTGHRTNRSGTWELVAIENRDSKGLSGFVEFASSLGQKGAQLAHLIQGLKP